MKTFNRTLFTFLVAWLLGNSALAQSALPSRLTYSAKLTFQSYGLPFKNISNSFKNVGGAISVDYTYNKAQNLQQTVTIGYQSHRQHEAGYYVNTQVGYRPHIFWNIEPTVAIGIGRLLTVANTKNPFYQMEEGVWKRGTKQTQGHWQAPISLNLGYRTYLSNGTTITPFVGYDATPIIKYNNALVVLPYSQVSLGTRISFNTLNKKHFNHEIK